MKKAFLRTPFFYSAVRSSRGAIFLILSDNKQTMPNETRISPIPTTVINPTGTVNVHFIMPKLLKNTLNIGLIAIQLIISPATVEMIKAGINESAVCKTS